MRILVIGGGVFLGAALLESALARGHAVTVFNRGRAPYARSMRTIAASCVFFICWKPRLAIASSFNAQSSPPAGGAGGPPPRRPKTI